MAHDQVPRQTVAAVRARHKRLHYAFPSTSPHSLRNHRQFFPIPLFALSALVPGDSAAGGFGVGCVRRRSSALCPHLQPPAFPPITSCVFHSLWCRAVPRREVQRSPARRRQSWEVLRSAAHRRLSLAHVHIFNRRGILICARFVASLPPLAHVFFSGCVGVVAVSAASRPVCRFGVASLVVDFPDSEFHRLRASIDPVDLAGIWAYEGDWFTYVRTSV